MAFGKREVNPFSALQQEEEVRTTTNRKVQPTLITKKKFVIKETQVSIGLFSIGSLSFSIGMGMIYHPLGLIFPGIICICLGILMSAEQKTK